MSRRSAGVLILGCGLLLGSLADATLFVGPWGLNAAVATVAVVGVIGWLRRGQHTTAGPAAVVHAIAALGLAACFVWRDATVLKVLDVLALLVVLGLMASEREGLVRVRYLSGYALRVAGTAAHTALGTPLLATTDVDWSRARGGLLLPRLAAVARGLAITVPIAVVFTVLLAQADAVFAPGLNELFDVDIVWVLRHAIATGACAWLAAGLLRAAVLRSDPLHEPPPRPSWFALGRIEIAMVLGTLDAVFAAFVWVQFRYLFGGSEWVRQVAGLSYSEYARRGFFELAAVTALVLPLLLVAHWLLRPERSADVRAFTVLAGLQVALVLVMLVSAFERMRLYRMEFGLTELRFYTSAFMVWLALVLVWFLITVVPGKREAFANGAVLSAGLALVALHAANPDALMVRANRDAPHGFDLSYALGLSADAAPALLDVAPSLAARDRGLLARALVARWAEPGEPDWRLWSAARAQARTLVHESEAELRGMVRTAEESQP
jgi:hypothetical protein